MRILIVPFIIFPVLLFGQRQEWLNKLDTSTYEINRPAQFLADNWGEYEKHNLKNGTGLIIEYGTMMQGILLGPNDYNNGKITVITEYKNNMKNGRSIQFYNYPHDTASVATYKNDTLNGPFYYKFRNGLIGSTGTYINGQIKGKVQYWTEDGDKLPEDIEYNKESQLYYSDNRLCNGKRALYDAGSHGIAYLYLKNGKIDSVYSYTDSYWGKSGVARTNYIDSSFQCISYWGVGNIISIGSSKIMKVNPQKVFKGIQYNDSNDVYFVESDSLVSDGRDLEYYPDDSHTIREEYFFKNGVRDGDWKFYNKDGIIDSVEVYKKSKLIKTIKK